MPVEALSRLKNQKTGKMPPLAELMAKILDSKKGTAEFVDLCDQSDVKDRDAELLAIAADHANDTTGAAAARLVVRNKDMPLLDRARHRPRRGEDRRRAGNIPDGSATPLLAKLIADKAQPLPVRQAAVKAMAHSHTGAALLLDMATKEHAAGRSDLHRRQRVAVAAEQGDSR